MNLFICCPCTPASGMGHYFRSLALAHAAFGLGHKVVFASDRIPLTVPFLAFKLPKDPMIVTGGLNVYDWVILDYPDNIPAPVKVDGIKTCLIDGIGHQNGTRADLIISQGLEGDYCAPDYLMLRPEPFRAMPECQRGDSWLVWGGSADRLGLLPAFALACPNEPAHLLQSDFTQDVPIRTSPLHWLTLVNETDIFYWGRQCDKTACAFGMWVYEALAMRLKVWTFAQNERQLKEAAEMDRRGWVRAWPRVGLPGLTEMQQWLSEPFDPAWPEIPADGAERVVRLLEAKL